MQPNLSSITAMAINNTPIIATALLTFFNDDNTLDLIAFARLCRQQQLAGIPYIVVAGTTGEGLLLSESEVMQLLQVAHYFYKNNIIVSINELSAEVAIRKAKNYLACGDLIFLLSPPMYVKPDAWMSEHFFAEFLSSVSDSTSSRVILYNNPSRNGVELSAELINSLFSKYKQLIGIKEASPNLIVRSKQLPALKVLCGNDEVLLHEEAQFNGIISVVSNLLPTALMSIYDITCSDLHKNRFMQVANSISKCNNPAGIKQLYCSAQGLSPRLRSPLRLNYNRNN